MHLTKTIVALTTSASIAVGALPVRSEPTTAAQLLFNEPATMLDIGVDRVNHMLKKLSFPAQMYYNSKTKRLNILSGLISFPNKPSEQQAYEICKNRLSEIRTLAMVVENESGTTTVGGYSYFSQQFLHYGVNKETLPPNLLTQIDGMIHVGIDISLADGRMTCDATLLQKGFSTTIEPQ